MFHDFCQSVTLVFCQRMHVSHDHHPRGPCCSRARISYDEPYMGAISYQKIFASALKSELATSYQANSPCLPGGGTGSGGSPSHQSEQRCHLCAPGPPSCSPSRRAQSGG